MSTDIDNIIIVNEEEIITTSLDGYFKNIAIISEFENASLVSGETFDVSGVEEYTTLAGVAVKFPIAHEVYKIAQKIFAQKTNTGVNKSALQKLAVIQVKSTDSSFESALTRIAYGDAYHFVLASQEDDDIISVANYFDDKRKIVHCQTSDADVLTDTAGNIAETLVDGGYKRVALYFHSADTYSLAGAVASVLCPSRPGKNNGKYNKVSGITLDTFTEAQKAKLEGNFVNYYTNFIGQAGSYMTRPLIASAFLTNGTKLQKQIILDRIILNLQSAGMDALEMQIAYDDRGGSVLEGKLASVLRQLQNEEIIKEDSVDDEGNKIVGQKISVLTVAQTKIDFPSKYTSQIFVCPAFVYLGLNADAVEINLGYSV